MGSPVQVERTLKRVVRGRLHGVLTERTASRQRMTGTRSPPYLRHERAADSHSVSAVIWERISYWSVRQSDVAPQAARRGVEHGRPSLSECRAAPGESPGQIAIHIPP